MEEIIGIQDRDKFAANMLQRACDALTEAEIALVSDDADPWIVERECLLECPVRGGIVNDQNLKVSSRLPEDASDRVTDKGFMVVGGNQDGDACVGRYSRRPWAGNVKLLVAAAERHESQLCEPAVDPRFPRSSDKGVAVVPQPMSRLLWVVQNLPQVDETLGVLEDARTPQRH